MRYLPQTKPRRQLFHSSAQIHYLRRCSRLCSAHRQRFDCRSSHDWYRRSFGVDNSTTSEAVKSTRTELGGDEAAVCRSTGSNSCVKRNGPRQLVPSWSSYPWALFEPFGGVMMPALFHRISRRVSFARKYSTLLLMVVKSARSRSRNSKRALESGNAAYDVLDCLGSFLGGTTSNINLAVLLV